VIVTAPSFYIKEISQDVHCRKVTGPCRVTDIGCIDAVTDRVEIQGGLAQRFYKLSIQRVAEGFHR